MFLAVVLDVILLSAVSFQDSAGCVAFSSVFDVVQTVAANDTLKFNRVTLNLGSGYDSKTGIFTAPECGVYVVHWSVESWNASEVWTDLWKNDEIRASSYARQRDDYDSAANTAVLALAKGDKLLVKTVRAAKLCGRSDELFATFNGYKLGGQCGCVA